MSSSSSRIFSRRIGPEPASLPLNLYDFLSLASPFSAPFASSSLLEFCPAELSTSFCETASASIGPSAYSPLPWFLRAIMHEVMIEPSTVSKRTACKLKYIQNQVLIVVSLIVPLPWKTSTQIMVMSGNKMTRHANMIMLMILIALLSGLKKKVMNQMKNSCNAWITTMNRSDLFSSLAARS